MTSFPSWVGPTAAIALVVIALAFLAIAVVVVVAVRKATSQASHLAHEIGELRRELAPRFRPSTRSPVPAVRSRAGSRTRSTN